MFYFSILLWLVDKPEREKPMAARILIIDNEPRWVNFVEANFGTEFEVEVATDLKTTLAKLKKNRYELIIVSSCRLDVLEIVRKEYPQKRLAVATGQESIREAIKSYRLGAFDYFTKDFRPNVVSKKIFEAIQKPVVSPV